MLLEFPARPELRHVDATTRKMIGERVTYLGFAVHVGTPRPAATNRPAVMGRRLSWFAGTVNRAIAKMAPRTAGIARVLGRPDSRPAMLWTDEEIRELITLWPTSSASQIASQLHRPRNAVVGKVKRLRQ